MSAGKIRVLMELRPAFQGYAGIPQETRLLFRGLSAAEGVELEGLEEKMGGIKNMGSLPGAIFVTSVLDDQLAVKEAIHVGIPIIALADTNIDPSKIDYPIPANDDAVSSLKLMLAYIAKAVLEGKENVVNNIKEEVKIHPVKSA